MSHTAKLVSIGKVADVDKELLSFVEFKASFIEKELKGTENVALLLVEGTKSYFPVFLDDISIGELEKQLREMDVELDKETRDVLIRRLN
ncbi:unnamed protein product [marine sediment metagenome]|uniref:DUF749 domain-containing protein n=1 Tax=marine sediment metagenome TaxID=412755 RepID=X0TN46_9ZZZZ